MEANMYNGLCLAYIGDSVFELYVRKYILSFGLSKVNALHKKAINYTSAIAQANIIHKLLNDNILNDNEISVFKRGRNSHINSARKNVDLATYLDATGFEALIGYLYLNNEINRLEELISIALDIK